MTVNVTQQTSSEVDDLVTRAQRLVQLASGSRGELGGESVQELFAIMTRGKALAGRLYGPSSSQVESLHAVSQTRSFSSMHSGWWRHVGELTGILQGIQHDVKAGLLNDVRALLRGEIFSDFIEMAEHLVSTGYKDAGAVIVGAVLEDSLRKLADKHGVPTVKSDGKPLTIDPLNIELQKAGAYNALIKSQITAWARVRNDAAHGKFGEYTVDDVKEMLIFVRKFCADHLN